MSQIGEIAEMIRHHNKEIVSLREQISELYKQNTVLLTKSKFVITDEVKENYKKIDALFAAKAKIEASDSEYHKKLMKVALGS